jgi:Rrf2 family iron-sulfur cluster assembly transcriptional regulator
LIIILKKKLGLSQLRDKMLVFFFIKYLTILVRFIYTLQNSGFMKLTSKGRYAVMALVDLARFDNINPVSLRDISLRQGISLDYLEQIFSKLRKKEIVQSVRGTQGGYVLNRKAKDIKLTNIFDAVDEKVKTVQCKKDSKKGCNGKATKCVTHNLWDELENHINNFFNEKSLEDLVKNNSEKRV